MIVGMSGQWENVATMLNIKLDFCCCENLVGFCKSSHIYSVLILAYIQLPIVSYYMPTSYVSSVHAVSLAAVYI